jgi:hypothetical protein
MADPTSDATAPPAEVREAAGVERDQIAAIRDLATAAGRSDLAARMSGRMRQLETWSTLRVLVVGDFKQGKSSLVNALLGMPICPVDVDFATAVPTSIHFADRPQAVSFHASDTTREPERRDVAVESLSSVVSEHDGPIEPDVVRCEVGCPVDWLGRGFEIVDMPGYGGLDHLAGARVVAELTDADTVLFVSDASQELTAPEMSLLHTVARHCRSVALVMTKTDAYVDWRRIRDANAARLGRAGIVAPVLAVSAQMHLGPPRLRDGSGIGDLLTHLTETVRASADVDRMRDIAADGLDALAQLEAVQLAEREALDPATEANIISELQATLRELGEMRLDSASWHRFLRDQTDDLRILTLDHLDAELEALRGTALQAIAEHDPEQIWIEFQDWLRAGATRLVGDVYEQLVERAVAVEDLLMSHLHEHHSMPVALGRATGGLELLGLNQIGSGFEDRSSEVAIGRSWSVAEPLLGVAGFIPGFGPVSLAVAAVAGLAFGRRALRERRLHALESRREQARQHLDGYLAEVRAAVAKPVDRYVSQAYRLLRDGVLSRADELERSASDSLKVAIAASTSTEVERVERRASVAAALRSIEVLERGLGPWATDVTHPAAARGGRT